MSIFSSASTRRMGLLIAGSLAFSVFAAACGDDPADPVAASSGIVTEGEWARASPMMADAGAAYMQITSASDDRLVSATVDASVAGRVEIHEVVAVEGSMGDDSMDDESMGDDSMDDESMGDDSMDEESMDDGHMMDMPMTMRELEGGLVLPAGETVALKPGGYHMMLLELPGPLETGEVFDIELTLESGETHTVSVEVRESAP